MILWPFRKGTELAPGLAAEQPECTIIFPCGFRVGEHVVRCSSTSCAICNPMTGERAAQINQRYLQEKGYDQPND